MTIAAPILHERRATAAAVRRPATLTPTSWNAEKRTIEVCWTTGARGTKFLWAAGELIDEELDTRGVRLDRLNAGAPVLISHAQDLRAQIGVVVPGSARTEGGRGYATLQLSDQPHAAPIVADIASGIIRNLSVGYTVAAWDVQRAPDSASRDLWRAVDWQPFEISFVTVPFDAGAQVRAADDLHPCLIRTLAHQEPTMTHTRTDVPADDRRDLTPTPSAPERSGTERPATLAELRSFFSTTHGAAGAYQLSGEERADFMFQAAERGMTLSETRSALQRFAVERRERQIGFISPVSAIDETYDNPAFHSRAIGDALYARLSGTAPTDQARTLMNLSMVQMAGDMLERRGVRGVRSMAPSEILNAAARGYDGHHRDFGHIGGMHSTSDFPSLLAGAGQRFLLDVFTAAGSAIKAVSRQRSANDFRQISGLQLSGFGTLHEVPETGEIKHGSFRERKETYALKTFAKQFALSRQAIINDDLNAFGDPIRVMARAAAETEASLFAELINSNPIMGDGHPLFSAEHRNVATAGALPSIDTLSDGRIAMRGQKDADGVTPLAAAPKFILASEHNETRVEQLLTSVQAPTSDATNPFAGKLTPLIDPRLAGTSWFLFADPALAPVLEHAYLNGQQGPHVEMKDGWDVLGQAFRVYMDFGAGIIDHRGAYKNAGAAS